MFRVGKGPRCPEQPYHSICPYVLVVGISSFTHISRLNGRGVRMAYNAATYAFCSLHTTHHPVQRMELAICNIAAVSLSDAGRVSHVHLVGLAPVNC